VVQRPEAALVLAVDEVEATADAIAAVQLPDGSIPWFPGGQMDPWNHVEALMALDVCARSEAAERGYAWLIDHQRPDGAWHAYYRDGEVMDATLDTNVSTYVATGAWMHHLATGDVDLLARLWPTVEAAVEFALGLQLVGGAISWACDAAGRGWPRGLLAGSSAVHLSLRCALQVGTALGHHRPAWAEAADRLAWAIRHRPQDFEPKDRWAMDWYYPVLGGALLGDAAEARLAGRWDEFVVPGQGVRCVADRPWVTAAETCELAMALVQLGKWHEAARLVEWAQHLRGDDAAYWTGANYDDGTRYPEEQPTWTSAAVVLAADAVAGGPTADLLGAGQDGARTQARRRMRSDPSVPISSKSPDPSARS
jgi:hypothetical protein